MADSPARTVANILRRLRDVELRLAAAIRSLPAPDTALPPFTVAVVDAAGDTGDTVDLVAAAEGAGYEFTDGTYVAAVEFQGAGGSGKCGKYLSCDFITTTETFQAASMSGSGQGVWDNSVGWDVPTLGTYSGTPLGDGVWGGILPLSAVFTYQAGDTVSISGACYLFTLTTPGTNATSSPGAKACSIDEETWDAVVVITRVSDSFTSVST